jgi:cytochrome c oxidase subunit 2
MRKGKALEAALLVGLFLAVTVLTIYGFASRHWMPRSASQHSAAIDGLITYLMVATGVLFVIGHLVLASFVWRYRDRGQPAQSCQISRKAEWIWTLVPVLAMTAIAEFGVLVLALPVWSEVYGEPPKDALVIEVVGKQFEWTFRYPGKDGKFGKVDPKLVHPTDNPLGLVEADGAATDDVLSKVLVLPAGRPVVVRIRSHDVLHSFCVPEFRVKQDAVPGFTATAQFTPTTPGTYEVACTEVCGMGHFRMKALAEVKTASEFDAWLKKQTGFFE